MATVSPDELLRLWSQERISSEMAIGHILQSLVHQQALIFSLQRSISTLREDLGQTAHCDDGEPAAKRKSRNSSKS